MSNAVWCDSCGSVFPEGLEGSESGIGEVSRIENSRKVSIQQTRHFCPSCVGMRSPAQHQWRPPNLTMPSIEDKP